MREYKFIYLKYDNTGFAKKGQAILFFKMANTPHKGKIRHIARLLSFVLKIQYFYRDEKDFAPDKQYYKRGKWNTLYFYNIFEER